MPGGADRTHSQDSDHSQTGRAGEHDARQPLDLNPPNHRHTPSDTESR